jgi:hypothetical protein
MAAKVRVSLQITLMINSVRLVFNPVAKDNIQLYCMGHLPPFERVVYMCAYIWVFILKYPTFNLACVVNCTKN